MEGNQSGVDASHEGWLAEGALKPTWEVERLWVMHLGDSEERFEIAWGDTFPSLWSVCWEWSFLCGMPKGPGDSAGWWKGVGESHVAIEESEPKEVHVSSVIRGEDEVGMALEIYE